MARRRSTPAPPTTIGPGPVGADRRVGGGCIRIIKDARRPPAPYRPLAIDAGQMATWPLITRLLRWSPRCDVRHFTQADESRSDERLLVPVMFADPFRAWEPPA